MDKWDAQTWPSAPERERFASWSLPMDAGEDPFPSRCQSHLTRDTALVVANAASPGGLSFEAMVRLDAGEPVAFYAMDEDRPSWWVALDRNANAWVINSTEGGDAPSLEDDQVFPLLVVPRIPYVPGGAPTAFHLSVGGIEWVVFGDEGPPRLVEESDGDPIVRDGKPIQCPDCRWSPADDSAWMCSCGHVWNTFDTRGECPACQHRWGETQCLGCEEWFPHSAWYGHA